MKNKMSQEIRQKMVDMFEDGKTYEEIAKETNYAVGTVTNVLALHYSPISLKYMHWKINKKGRNEDL